MNTFLTTIFLERIILDEHFFFAENVFQPFFDNKNFGDKFLDSNFFTTTLMRTFLKRTSDKKILDGKSKR